MGKCGRKMVWERVRDRKRRPVGIICARRISETEICFGYSLCNDVDEFNFVTGMKMAIGRLDTMLNDEDIPVTIKRVFMKFVRRFSNYFQIDIFTIKNITGWAEPLKPDFDFFSDEPLDVEGCIVSGKSANPLCGLLGLTPLNASEADRIIIKVLGKN